MLVAAGIQQTCHGCESRNGNGSFDIDVLG